MLNLPRVTASCVALNRIGQASEDRIVLRLAPVLITLRELTCSHRLRGLPSSSDSPSPLHMRTLPPQKPLGASSWPGTVEPQPPQNRPIRVYHGLVSLRHTRNRPSKV